MHSRTVVDRHSHQTISRGLTKNEYRQLHSEAHNTAPIKMARRCFVSNDTNFTLDSIVTHHEGMAGRAAPLCVLSFETSQEGDEALERIPDAFEVVHDVTGVSLLQLAAWPKIN